MCAGVAGLFSYFVGAGTIFYIVAGSAAASVACVLTIPSHTIDHDRARGFCNPALPLGNNNSGRNKAGSVTTSPIGQTSPVTAGAAVGEIERSQPVGYFELVSDPGESRCYVQ